MKFERESPRITQDDTYAVYDCNGRRFGMVAYRKNYESFVFEYLPDGVLAADEATSVSKFLKDLNERLKK